MVRDTVSVKPLLGLSPTGMRNSRSELRNGASRTLLKIKDEVIPMIPSPQQRKKINAPHIESTNFGRKKTSNE